MTTTPTAKPPAEAEKDKDKDKPAPASKVAAQPAHEQPTPTQAELDEAKENLGRAADYITRESKAD